MPSKLVVAYFVVLWHWIIVLVGNDVWWKDINFIGAPIIRKQTDNSEKIYSVNTLATQSSKVVFIHIFVWSFCLFLAILFWVQLLMLFARYVDR